MESRKWYYLIVYRFRGESGHIWFSATFTDKLGSLNPDEYRDMDDWQRDATDILLKYRRFAEKLIMVDEVKK